MDRGNIDPIKQIYMIILRAEWDTRNNIALSITARAMNVTMVKEIRVTESVIHGDIWGNDCINNFQYLHSKETCFIKKRDDFNVRTQSICQIEKHF